MPARVPVPRGMAERARDFFARDLPPAVPRDAATVILLRQSPGVEVFLLRRAGALEFEDPRHARMMHAPMRRANARADRQPVVAMAPARGTLLLWESWLRHAVPTNRAAQERISISFNYDL